MSLPRHSHPATLLGVGLVAALALGGCSGSGGASSGSAAMSGPVAPGSADEAASDAGASPDAKSAEAGAGAPLSGTPGASGTSGSAQGSPAAPADVIAGDKLVRTASLQLQVDDVEAKAADVRRIAVAVGGVVTSENSTAVPIDSGSSTLDKSGSKSVIALAVPSDSLDRVLDDLGKLGTAIQRTSSSRDVTTTYVDTQSRIATMKAALDQLRALLGKTTELSQVVSLETEISRRQADLDSLQAQLSALDKKVSLSTVTVTLSTVAQPVQPADDGSGFLGGLRKGWQAFVGASGALLTAVGLLLPFVLLVAVLGLPVLLWRRRRQGAERGESRPQYAAVGPSGPGSGTAGSGSNGGSGSGGPNTPGPGDPHGAGSAGPTSGGAATAPAASPESGDDRPSEAAEGSDIGTKEAEVTVPVEPSERESRSTPVPV